MHQLAALILEDAADDGGLGMHGVGGKVVIASLLVGGSVDDTWYLRPAYGSGTHGAGLYRYVERAVGQILAAQRVGCSGDGLHLGVGCHVTKGLCQVVGTGDDAVFADDDGTDGNLTCIVGQPGLVERHLHVALIFFLLFFANHGAKLQFFLYLCKRIMDFKIIHIEETDSTNRWLKEHGEGNMIVVADYQTAGKGCGTNSWESERGQNLTFSMLIHPQDIAAKYQFRITEVVSVALCETLQSYIYNNKVEIKWPNDIYVGDKKICGILIENRLQGQEIRDSIIGIGLNVNQTEFRSDAPNPVSLCQVIGQKVDRDRLLQCFIGNFLVVSSRETVSFQYRNCLFLRGKLAEYADVSGRFIATIVDVEPEGRLVLQDEKGLKRTYAFKEVTFVL